MAADMSWPMLSRKRIVTYGKQASRARAGRSKAPDKASSPLPAVNRDAEVSGILERPEWLPAPPTVGNTTAPAFTAQADAIEIVADTIPRPVEHARHIGRRRDTAVPADALQDIPIPPSYETQGVNVVVGNQIIPRAPRDGQDRRNPPALKTLTSRPVNHGEQANMSAELSTHIGKRKLKQNTLQPQSISKVTKHILPPRTKATDTRDQFDVPSSDSDEQAMDRGLHKKLRAVKSMNGIVTDSVITPAKVATSLEKVNGNVTVCVTPQVDMQRIEINTASPKKMLASKSLAQASAPAQKNDFAPPNIVSNPENLPTKSRTTVLPSQPTTAAKSPAQRVASKKTKPAVVIPPREQNRQRTPPTPPSELLKNIRLTTPKTSGTRQVVQKTPASHHLSPRGKKIWTKLVHVDKAPETTARLDASLSKRADAPIEDGLLQYAGISKTYRAPRMAQRRRLIDALLRQHDELEERTSSASPSPSTGSQEADALVQMEDVQMKDNQDIAGRAHTQSDSQASHQAIAAQKRTYGTHRTWLPEENLMDALALGFTTQPPEEPSRTEGTEPAKEEAVNNILTFHELRQAGANSRVDDEVRDCLDRIGSPASATPSARRSGLLDLAEKLRSREFAQHFRGSGYEHELFTHLGQETDAVAGFVMLSLLTSLLQEASMPHMVAHLRRHGIARLLIRLLALDSRITALAKERRSNMSRVGQSLVAEQHEHLLKTINWEPLTLEVITPRTLALKTLELLVRQTREAGIADELMSKELTTTLFAIVQSSACDDVWTLSSWPVAINFYLAMSALESHSLVARTVQDEAIWTSEYLPVIASTLEQALKRPVDEHGRLQLLLFRLTLNVTNNNRKASDVFAQAPLLRSIGLAVVYGFQQLNRAASEEELDKALEFLVLMLGVLINFGETSVASRACVQSLAGSDDDPLERILQIFTDNQEKAAEASSIKDTRRNIPYGYLAVWLGYLCLEPGIAERVKGDQPGRHLQPLIGFTEEFMIFHRAVDAQVVQGSDGNGASGTMTARLATLVRDLRKL